MSNCVISRRDSGALARRMDQQQTLHSSNYAVILSTSRYWFNYRHVNNALAIYRIIKDHGGIPDENIILMLADEIPVNPRNPNKNGMYMNGVSTTATATATTNFMEHVQIDYRGDQVTVENLSRVLLGLSYSSSSNTRTLDTNQDSHILLYWTGHGGDGFFKFQDVEEITAADIQRLFQRMYDTQRYKEILFIVDTCQAFTLADEITAPNIYTVGSSLRNENSFAHHNDFDLGVSVIERYTYAIYEFIQQHDSVRRQSKQQQQSLQHVLVDHLRYEQQHAHIGVRQDTCQRNFTDVPLSDFFANVQLQQQQSNQAAEITLLPTNAKTAAADDDDDVNRTTYNNSSPRVKQWQTESKNTPPLITRTPFKVQHGVIPNRLLLVVATTNHHHELVQPTDSVFLIWMGIFVTGIVVTSLKW